MVKMRMILQEQSDKWVSFEFELKFLDFIMKYEDRHSEAGQQVGED